MIEKKLSFFLYRFLLF